MIRAILICLAFASTGYSSFADDIVNKFECSEKATTLKITSVVTESRKEPWRFFISVESMTKMKAVLESRSFSGFDYDTHEQIYGYMHNSPDGSFYYEELTKGSRTRRNLTLKMPYLTGDTKSHSLTCKSL